MTAMPPASDSGRLSFNAGKDEAITNVLARLESDLGPGAFVLADHWPDDLMAVGIARRSAPGYLVYISTLGCKPDCYHVELELPPKPNDDFPYTPAGEFASVDYAALLEIVKRHLGVGLRAIDGSSPVE